MSKKNPEPEISETAPEKPAEKQPEKYRIVIHKQEGPGGSDDVPVGVNGRVWQIKREREVTVPAAVYNALMEAVETRYVMTDDEIRASENTRFPISVRGVE